MDNTYNTHNSTTLAHDITKIRLNKHHRMLTLDIKDLYTNIPIEETIQIAENRAQKHNDTKTTSQIALLLNTILKQNYFRFGDKIYQPPKGVAMGSPISGLIAEVFLQHLENTHIKHIMERQHITLYTRYVDDILIIYDNRHITAETILNHINTIHPNITFDLTMEENNQICYLDLKLIRLTDHIEVDIHRKPTTTDTTIHNSSNHPHEHKMAAYRYMITRMTTLPLTQTRKETEWQTITTIAKNNDYPIHTIKKLRKRIENKTHTKKNDTDNPKWTTFTYHNHTIRQITNLFKHTNLRIAYRSTNKIQNLIKHKQNTHKPDHEKSGIYQLKCNTCKLNYIGQTSRNLRQRHKEHTSYIKKNNHTSAYALHILQNRHEYGPLNEKNDTTETRKQQTQTPGIRTNTHTPTLPQWTPNT